ncbi:MAG TPA: ABC transporter permease, partial [Saprospiraceae bacterium]|nr:ABC transporter permease [Saprospiraceae bacterium]
RLALRSLRNNRLSSFLNIAGLAVGLAAGILVLLWVADEFSYNKFHTNLPNIHMILQNQTQGGVTYTFEALPGPLAAALRSEMPEVKRVFRFSWPGQNLLTLGDKSTYERGFYAEPDFFKALTFPAVKGDPVAALQDAGSIVITERTAKKFFGDEDPIGKVLRHNNQRDLKVAAVVRDVPPGSTIRFDVLLPFRIYEQMNKNWIDFWDNNSMPTWVELQPGADIAALNAKLENYIQAKKPDAAAHIFAYPLDKWRLWGKFEGGKQSGGRIDIVVMLGIIGIFVLLIACINFMNLATARSERRAREVGVRKVVGAQRSLIIGQFLSEALVMTFLALVLGIVLVKAVLPAFNRFFEKQLVFDFSNWQLWSAILGLGLVTGLLAGSYPAIFLSKFNPARVLRGGFIAGGKGGSLLRRSLVTFQFVISIFLIISTIVVFRQIEHAQNRPLGYDAENLIEIPARGDMTQKFDVLRNELTQLPGVTSVSAGSDDLIQFGSNTSGISWPGKTDDQDFLVTMTWVRHDWTKTAGLKIIEGRDFSPEYGSDTMACLLNRTAVKRMGLKEPVVGTTIRHDTTRTVIGVVEDFVYNDPFSSPAPMAIFLDMGAMQHFFVRFPNDENWRPTLAQIEQVVKKHNPAYPFEFRFTKDEYQKNFEEMRSVGQLGNVFGGLAIFISCLGLFGLSAFVAERRTKEIGVRKVLGATMANIWFTLSKDFMKPVFFAFVLAAPLAFWAMQKLLLRFEYRIEMSWWMFAAAGAAAVAIALLTVSYQGVKAALVNPVKSLRSE